MPALSVPPARRYSDQIVSLPDPWQVSNPPEGPRKIPLGINWATQGGPNNCVSFELYGGGNLSANSWSKVAALSVDNSLCGATIRFSFPDCEETITIPAYSPKVIVPVFSQSNVFYVEAIGLVIASDVSRFMLHNTVPPPIAIPTSQEQSVASVMAVNVTGVALTQVVAAGINGTLEGGSISFSSTINGTAFSTTGYVVKDGTGKVLAQLTWAMNGEADIPENAEVWNVTGAHLRFQNGIVIQQSVIYGAVDVNQVYMNANLYYRAG